MSKLGINMEENSSEKLNQDTREQAQAFLDNAFGSSDKPKPKTRSVKKVSPTKVPEKTRSASYTFNLPIDLHKRLKKHAFETEQNMSGILAQVIESYLEKNNG